MKIGAYIAYGVNEVLYKLFGVNTPSRKAQLKYEAIKLQYELDKQHNKRDKFNKLHGTDWTTKAVMEIIEL